MEFSTIIIIGNSCRLTTEDAKEMHRCLRLAAGIFKEMHANYTGRLMGAVAKGSDTDPRILIAFINQCTAEAQEGIISFLA